MPDLIPETPSFIKIDEIEATIEKYEKEVLGLDKYERMDEPSYLRMHIDELRKKSPEELAEATIQLSRFSMNIQRRINRERSWLKWAKLKLDEFAAHDLPNVSTSYGWGGSLLLAKNASQQCKQLNGFIREIEMKIERLYDLPKHIDVIASAIKDYRFVNMRREKEYNA